MKEQAFYLEGESKMYYEVITPSRKKYKETIILLHGGAQTGSCYKTTPDGRDGWAYYFVERGFEVCIPDWPGCGRSGYVPLEKINGNLIVDGLSKLIKQMGGKIILITHSMSGPYGWKLAEVCNKHIVKLIGVAPGLMGNIQPIADIINQTGQKMTIDFRGRKFNLNLAKPFVCDKDFIDKKMIGENSKLFPRKYKNNFSSSVQTLAPYLLYERLNTKGSQLKINNTAKLKTIKFAVVTGTADMDHPKELDMQIITFLKANGLSADFIYLGDKNISGNGHMCMLEKNNLEIADIIFNWMTD